MKKFIFTSVLFMLAILAKSQVVISCPECGHKITIYITTGDSTKVTAVHETTKEADKAVASGRCQATTKAGTQCSRNASNGSKFCWQHANQSGTTATKQTTSSNRSTSSASSGGGQCKARTKKGTRCSRAARSNGYCWQHGG